MTIKEEYRKERRRIQSFLRRAKQRGYRFDEGTLPSIPKKITRASVRRLKKLTPVELYKKSTALSESGKIITGTERRKEERKEASKKAAQTRYSNRSKSSTDISIDVESVIYNQILTMIEEYSVFHPQTSSVLMKILQNAIETQGFRNVMNRLDEVPEDAIEAVQKALVYREDSDNSKRQIRNFAIILQGRAFTVDEAKYFEDTVSDFLEVGYE